MIFDLFGSKLIQLLERISESSTLSLNWCALREVPLSFSSVLVSYQPEARAESLESPIQWLVKWLQVSTEK